MPRVCSSRVNRVLTDEQILVKSTRQGKGHPRGRGVRALAKAMGQEQTWHLHLAAQSKEGWIFIDSHGILEASGNLFKKRVHTQDVLLSFKDNYTAATNHHHGASLVAQMVKNPPAVWETWVQSLGWEDPLEEGGHGNPL